NLSLSLFACDKAADHTFRVARDPSAIRESDPTSLNRTGLPLILGSPDPFRAPRLRVLRYAAFACRTDFLSFSNSLKRLRKRSWDCGRRYPHPALVSGSGSGGSNAFANEAG